MPLIQQSPNHLITWSPHLLHPPPQITWSPNPQFHNPIIPQSHNSWYHNPTISKTSNAPIKQSLNSWLLLIGPGGGSLNKILAWGTPLNLFMGVDSITDTTKINSWIWILSSSWVLCDLFLFHSHLHPHHYSKISTQDHRAHFFVTSLCDRLWYDIYDFL